MIKYLTLILLISISGCKIYIQNSDYQKREKEIENENFSKNVGLLNRDFLDRKDTFEICNFKLILKLIANSKVEFKEIEITPETEFLIWEFLFSGYQKVKYDKLPTYSMDEIQKKLDLFLMELYKLGKKNNNEINNSILEKVKKSICPLYPFC